MYAGAILASTGVRVGVFDLYDVVDYNVDVHDDWIDAAVKSL